MNEGLVLNIKIDAVWTEIIRPFTEQERIKWFNISNILETYLFHQKKKKGE